MLKHKKLLRLATALVAFYALSSSIFAATIQVTSQIGQSGCDLAEAIATANSNTPTGGCIANNGSFTVGGRDLIVLNFAAPISEFVVSSVDGSNSSLSGLPAISSDIKILGRGGTAKVVIKRAEALSTPEFRLFVVTGSGSLSLENISVRNGRLSTGSGSSPRTGGAIQIQGGLLEIDNSEFINNQSSLGGAISMSNNDDSVVTIRDTLFSNNRSTETFSGGGAILNGRGELTVIDSSFIGNQSSAIGGALVVASNTTTMIRNSLFSENTSGGNGGAIHVGSTATISIYDSTISGNSADTVNFGYGGGIALSGGSGTDINLSIINTTISGNEARRGGGIALDRLNPFGDSNLTVINSLVSGNSSTDTHTSSQEIAFGPQEISLILQNNLIGHADYTTAQAITGDSLNLDTNILATSDGDTPTALNNILLPLSVNGGFTATHALPPSSPAIDAATDGTAVNGGFINFYLPGCRGEEIGPISPIPPYRPDQRGEARPLGGACDIGSYEAAEDDSQCYVIKAVNGNVATFCL
jgi:predicted outer membrane repeat protein